MATKKRTTIKTPLFRGSFVYLATPKKDTNEAGMETEAYKILIPLKKDAPATKACIKELLAAVAEASAAKHGKAIPPADLKHFPIKNGDKFENEDFHGHWCINAKANYKPSVVDINGDVLLTGDEIYSGAWYKAMLSCYAWTNAKGGKGVSINIESAIKLKDDTRFGGGSNAAEDFAEDLQDGGTKDDENMDLLGL